MKGFALLILSISLTLAACSKSPGETIYAATTAATRPLMQNLVEKDASHEVNGLIALIANKPECEVYKQALREVGKGSPYEGSTQLKISRVRQDACNAGCCTG
jgi:hypothetical protein